MFSDQSGQERHVYLFYNQNYYVYDRWASPVGSGATAQVYLGYNCSTWEPVAVKEIRSEYSGIAEVRQRIREEGMMSFSHPNIVRMYGACEPYGNEGPIYLLSEFIQGQNMDIYSRDKLAYCGNREKIRVVLNYSIQILNALQYLHNLGVIHRDIKPSNIMIAQDGTPKLMDLGLAGFGSHGYIYESEFAGTFLYAAPELIRGEYVDFRIDIYAMGVAVYELLTGYNPFYSCSTNEISMMQQYNDLPEDTLIPAALLEILRVATCKDRDGRFFSTGQFASELHSFLNAYV